jgi:hypothetical protein
MPLSQLRDRFDQPDGPRAVALKRQKEVLKRQKERTDFSALLVPHLCVKTSVPQGCMGQLPTTFFIGADVLLLIVTSCVSRLFDSGLLTTNMFRKFYEYRVDRLNHSDLVI